MVRSLVCQRRILVIARDAVSIALYVFTLSCFLASGLAFLNLKGETDKMRRLALTIALACVFSGVARAGEIHSTGAVTPPPDTVTAAGEIPTTGAPAPQPSNSVVTTGEIHTTGAATPETSSTLSMIILTIISIVR